MIQETPSTLEAFVKPRNISGSFSIFTRAYEKELDRKYGIELRALKNGERSGFRGDLQNNVPFTEGTYGSARYFPLNKVEKLILNPYKTTPGFCCMRLDDERELLKHIRFIHEVSYNHYVWGKERMRLSFPRYCCGSSASNLLLTLMTKGYPNTTLFHNWRFDHVYNGLPFVLGEHNERGFIIVDPTSDQLFQNKHHAPRNHLFVVFGTDGEYKTDWEWGADLFPNEENRSGFSNLHTLRERPLHSTRDQRDMTKYLSIETTRDMPKYFREVFKNQVKVTVDSLPELL